MKDKSESVWAKIKLDFIKTKRLEMGYSLQDMAEILDFRNASTYMKYEIGEYQFKANHLPPLAVKLNCEIEDFFENKFAELAKNEIGQSSINTG
jgi:transcriptional regulator with XRE-family HTH domain